MPRINLYISELLFLNDCVIIPGLGGFVANTRSAFLNPAQHTFTPPSRRVAFNASLRTNDGLLAHHVSRRQGISYGEALAEVKVWVDDLVARLHAGEQVWLDKIGSLVFDAENRIQFEPDLTENYLTDSFGLVSIHSPAIRRDEQPAKVKKLIPVKEKKKRQGWKLLELIPAAAVLAILAFNPNVIKVANPKAKSDTKAKQTVVISVDKNQQLFIGAEPVALESLESRLQEYLSKENEKPTVVINGDSTSHLGTSIKVMQIIKKLGATPVMAVDQN